MLLDSTSAFITTVGENHTLVLPDSVPIGSRVAVVLIEEKENTTAAIASTEEADAWDLLMELIRTAPSGKLRDASENHDQYLYGGRL